MKLFKDIFLFNLLMVALIYTLGFGQHGRPYRGPDDPAGDDAAFRSGYLQGNRFYFFYHNNTSITDTGHGVAVWNRWPNNYEGSTLVHGICAVMAARVFIEGDSIPVTDPEAIASRTDLTVLHYAQQGFRNRTDLDPTGTFEWGMKPVFGYFNELDEYAAASNMPNSWPPEGWPSTGDDLKWPGEWNGRFGRGVMYADQEIFHVVNDAHDQEYLGVEDTVKYYPRPGLKIGDKKPDVTIQKGLPWGGLGLRMEIRAFQWNNPQARDAVFFEYTTANVSDYDLPEMCFGFYFHPYVGQDSNDDYLYFNKKLDMSYNWDSDGVGQGGIPTCAFGIAYLESPGKPYDNIDNDEDGLTDEKRDNVAVTKVGPTDGITNLDKFLEFYGLTEDMLVEHWDADEDQDWKDGNDVNGDGIYQLEEDAGGDVGLDGVGPTELNYNGPDEGECNHKPDFIEGVGCEPDFAVTDVSESDMLGLTSFHTFDHDTKPRIHADDVLYWEYFSDPTFDEFQNSPGAWVNLFATGIFPLYQGRTERISMGLIGAYDPLEGLNSSSHRAPSLWRKKEIAQVIYESDYRFAQPPKMPTLSATALDGKVVLTWDDVADKKTREPFLKYINDFEGYKLFKATDKKFSDAEVITDGYGTPLLKKPIYQCDLRNRRLGFTDYGLVDGVGYYLGEDTGLRHYFVDTNVQNGKTYYYALVAYDYGIPELGDGVAPSENNVVLELDEAEEIRFAAKNVQIVTPRSRAAGYQEPQLELLGQSFHESTGTVMPRILTPDQLKPNHTYKVEFYADTARSDRNREWGVRYTTNGYKVWDVTDQKLVLDKFKTSLDSSKAPINVHWMDSLEVYTLDHDQVFETDNFDGLYLDVKLNTPIARQGEIDYEHTGWKVGNLDQNIVMTVTPAFDNAEFYPWEYDIIFGDEGMYQTRARRLTRARDEFNERVDQSLILEESFNFTVLLKSFADTSGNHEMLDLVVQDMDTSGTYDMINDRVFAGVLDDREGWFKTVFVIDFEAGSALPQPNDVYHLAFKRPFFVTDSLLFRVLPSAGTDLAQVKSCMDSIQVVPNPYVATNSMEPSVANHFLNQRRRIMFNHLPARCEIKIFTVSGVLVDEIDVENAADNGIAHWDLLTKEGLEVAAGMYVYYVKAKETNDVKVGKFGIIK